MFYKIGVRRLFLRLGLLIGLLVITAWLLLAPTPLPFGISIQREMGFVGHVGLFTMVTLACAAAFPGTIGRATGVLLLAAIGLEAAQVFAPTRDVDFTDLAMNCLGVLFGRMVFRSSATLRAIHSSRRRVKP